MCYQKNNGVAGVHSVPGCLGTDFSRSDFCTLPGYFETPPSPTPLIAATLPPVSIAIGEDTPASDAVVTATPVVLTSTSPPLLYEKISEVIPLVWPTRTCTPDSPCGKCEGDCDIDDDCETGMICFQKNKGVRGLNSVPGCIGHDLSRTDWCIPSSDLEATLLRQHETQ